MTLSELLQRVTPDAQRGVGEADLLRAESELGFLLPPDVRQFFSIRNGGNVVGGLRILPLDEAVSFARTLHEAGHGNCWAYLPITDSNDSNPFCISCGPLLCGRVVHFFHDDSPRIAFRNLTTFLTAIDSAVTPQVRLEDWFFIGDLSYEYTPASPRDQSDIWSAATLEQYAAQPECDEDWEIPLALSYAAWLYSEDHLGDLVRLADHPDEFARRGGRERLGGLQSPQANSALRQIQQEQETFARLMAETLLQAGFPVREVQPSAIRIGDGHELVWLNVESFYGRRNEPGIWTDVIERTRQLRKLKF